MMADPGAADPALARVDVAAVLVQRPRTAAERLALGLAPTTLLTADAEEWFSAGPFDAVLEVAGHEAVRAGWEGTSRLTTRPVLGRSSGAVGRIRGR